MSDPRLQVERAQAARASILRDLERRGTRPVELQDWAIEQERERKWQALQGPSRTGADFTLRRRLMRREVAPAPEAEAAPAPAAPPPEEEEDESGGSITAGPYIGPSSRPAEARDRLVHDAANVARKVGETFDELKKGQPIPGPGTGPREGTVGHELSEKATGAVVQTIGAAERGIAHIRAAGIMQAEKMEREAYALKSEGLWGRGAVVVAGAGLTRMASGALEGFTFAMRPWVWGQSVRGVGKGLSALVKADPTQRREMVARGLTQLADPHTLAEVGGQIVGGLWFGKTAAEVRQATAPKKLSVTLKRGTPSRVQKMPVKHGPDPPFPVTRRALTSTVDDVSRVPVIQRTPWLHEVLDLKREGWGKVLYQTGAEVIPGYAPPGQGTLQQIIQRKAFYVDPSLGLTPSRVAIDIIRASRGPALTDLSMAGLGIGLASGVRYIDLGGQEERVATGQPSLQDVAEQPRLLLRDPSVYRLRPIPTEPGFAPPLDLPDEITKIEMGPGERQRPTPMPPHQLQRPRQDPILDQPSPGEPPRPRPPLPVYGGPTYRPPPGDMDMRLPGRMERRPRARGPAYGIRRGMIKMTKAELRELIG